MKVRSFSNRRRRAAFTLMEMMVVVAIIVALAGTAIFYMAGQADEGNKARVKANIKSLTDAVVIYKTQHAGAWPESLQSLLQKDDQGHGPYVANAENLLDPWNRAYNYDPNGSNNGGAYPDIWSDTPFGKIANWSNKLIK